MKKNNIVWVIERNMEIGWTPVIVKLSRSEARHCKAALEKRTKGNIVLHRVVKYVRAED